MQFHPVANIFPMMQPDEYEALVEDIRTNGLLAPIWTHEGLIIDGRNRWRACQEAGVAPMFREWSGQGSLVAFVVSLNLKRRHLDSGQRAVLALEIEKQLAVEAKARQGARNDIEQIFAQCEAGRAREQAAAIVGTNRQYVSDAKRIERTAPELLPLVSDRTLSFQDAKKLAKENEQVRAGALEKISTGTANNAPHALAQIRGESLEQEKNDAIGTAPLVTCSDWREWLCKQPSCDLLFTDPPYSTDVDNITSFAHQWLPVALSKVVATGRAYVCIGAYPDELAAYLTAERSGLVLANVLVWTYRNTMGPSPTLDYKLNWQAILYFRGPQAPPLRCDSLIEQFSVQDISAPDARTGIRYHAWQKPDELAERLIRHSTAPGETVIDPFAGTGTFLLSAARLGRQAMGCDSDSKMVEIAVKRGCKWQAMSTTR